MLDLKRLLGFSPFRHNDRPALSCAPSGPTVQPDIYKLFIDLMATGFAYFEVLCNDAGDPVDCRYLAVNGAFEHISGLMAEQVVGKTVRERNAGMEESWVGFLGRVALTGAPATMEWFNAKQKRHYIVHAFSIRSGFCAITFEDVTERAQAEEKLRLTYSRLSAIMELSEDLIFRLDTEGVVQSISLAAESVVGYAREEILGRKFFEFVVPEDLPIAEAAQKEVVSGNSVRGVSFRSRSKDGKIIYLEINSMPVVENGRIVGQQGTVRDITARQLAEAALRQKTVELELERQNLQTLFNSAQVGMLLVDAKGVIRRVNEAATKLFQQNPQDLLGRRPGEAFCCVQVVEGGKVCGESPDCLGCPFWTIVKAVLESGQVHPPVEVSRDFFIAGKRCTVWLEVGAARVSISGAADVLVSLSNITERKKIEAALKHSEKRLGDIINAFPLPSYCQDLEGRCQIFNQEFVDFVGMPPEKIRNMTVVDNAPKELTDIWNAKDQDLLAHPGSQVFELSYGAGDGRLRHIVCFKRTLHDSEGRLQGIVGTILDITERKNAESRVKDSERRLEEFLNATPVPMFLKDNQGIYVLCNQAFAEYHGRAIKDIIGKTSYQIAPEKLAEQFEKQDGKVLQDGKTMVAELEAVHLSGGTRDLMIYKNVHYDAKGNVVGVIGTIVDITERKQAEQEIIRRGEEVKDALAKLQLAHEQLQRARDQMVQSEKLAAIGLLAAGVAHEVNNPLGFIGTNLNALAEYIKKLHDFFVAHRSLYEALAQGDSARINQAYLDLEVQRQALGMEEILDDLPPLMAETREGFERIRKIVNELRNFSRTDQILVQQVNVNVVLDGVLRMLWNEVKYKADVKKDLGVIPLISGNPQQLGQVFMNILVNAHQAIVTRGTIFVRTYSRDQEVVVEIGDTGTGIPADVMGKIFDPFFTTKAPGEGTGLGLSISYDIVKRHGGSIGAESEVGKGTKFIITFPALEPKRIDNESAGA